MRATKYPDEQIFNTVEQNKNKTAGLNASDVRTSDTIQIHAKISINDLFRISLERRLEWIILRRIT